MSISESQEINISWQTVSKAALKSRNIKNVCPESTNKRMSLTTRERAISVLYEGQNPEKVQKDH